MMKFFQYAVLAAVTLCVASCSDDGGTGVELPLVNQTEIVFGEHADNQYVIIGASGSWSIENSTQWLSFDALSGKGRDSIPILATANPADRERTGSFTVKSGSNAVNVAVTQRPDVDISGVFQCERFRNYCFDHYDANKDGILMSSEVSGVTMLNVRSNGIESLAGIEYFYKLGTLDCSNNNLITLNVRSNVNLLSIDFSNNLLEGGVSFDGCDKLTTVNGSGNGMTGINVLYNTNLQSLVLTNNQINLLDISNNRRLSNLNCTNCPKLKVIYIWEGCSPSALGFKVPEEVSYLVK